MASATAASQPSQHQILGHPSGLIVLFFTELWERFSYYGMRALLVLFMTAALAEGGLQFTDPVATAIYGMYTAGVYLAALPGGWIADRLIGQQSAIWYGGIVIALGHFTMAFPLVPDLLWGAGALAHSTHMLVEHASFFVGLILIVLGTGLLKPNISAVVGELYPEGGARRDAGFTIFYMGINVGALLGPLVCGYLGEGINWHYGFLAAGVGMVLALISFRISGRLLGHAGAEPHHPASGARRRRNWLGVAATVGVIALLVVLGLTGTLAIDAVAVAGALSYIIVSIAAVFFLWVLIFGQLSPEEKRRVGVIAAFFVGAAVFWSGFEQAGSSLNLFGERYTDRVYFGWEMPASWLQSVNPLFIILLAPFFSWLWITLARRNLEPSAPMKFALGLVQLGLGFGVMALAASLAASSGETVMPTWLLLTYLVHTTGELCLSPVGLSWVTKLAPRKFVSQMMGIWFMGAALGNLIAGQVAGVLFHNGEGTADPIIDMPYRFTVVLLTTAVPGLLFAIFARPLKHWIGSVK